MNEEIKEILKILKKCYDLKDENFDNCISLYQLGLLLDYIINLEKENEAKEKVIKKQDYVINELEKWLKGLIDNFDDGVSEPILHEQMTIRLVYDYLGNLKELKKEGK